jgi:hypothetical protein
MARKTNFKKQAKELTNKFVADLYPLMVELVQEEVAKRVAEDNRAQLELFADTPAAEGVAYEFCDGGTLGANATAKVINDTIPPEATGVIEIDMSIPETEPPTDYAGLTGDGVTFSVAVSD